MLWLSLATYGCHWRAMLWQSLASYGCHWRALSLASYGCHWRTMPVIAELRLTINKPILGTLPGLGLKLAPKTSQEAILKHFQTQAQKSLREASRRPTILKHFQARPKSHSRGLQTDRETDKQPGNTSYCHWQAMLWLSLESYGCHCRDMAVIDQIWLSVASHDCHWRAMTVIGELWLSLVGYGCHG